MLDQSAELAFQELLESDSVRAEVKELLLREYEQRDALFEIFVSHSSAVTQASLAIAQSCGADMVFVREAAWLHDVGIKYTQAPGIHCFGEEHYLKHGIIGRALCEEVGLLKHGLVCERHVGTGLTALEIESQNLPLPRRDMLCESLEERLICYADQFFSKSTPQRLSVEEVSMRVKRHGAEPWLRFEDLHAEFAKHLSLR